MLSVVALGAVCELDDGEPRGSTIDGSTVPTAPREAAPDPDPVPARLRRVRRRHAALEDAPRWQRRWEAYRERRRKHVGIRFTEFADLSDGRRVLMRDDRGYGWSWRHSPGPWHGDTRESLADDARDYFAYEEENCCLVTPEWVVEHIQRHHGLQIDAASAQVAIGLPRRIEFGPRLLQELPDDEPPAGPSSGPPPQGQASQSRRRRRRGQTAP